MQRRNNLWQPLAFAVVLAIGLAGGYFLKSGGAGFSAGGKGKIGEVLNMIRQSYVDTVNGDDLTEAAIIEMLHTLDPHSNYIPAAEVAAVNEQLEGNFEGIGVEFNLLNDTIFIVTVLPEGPSEKAGLMQGDRIIKVEGENVAGIGIKNGDVIKKLKGPRDTKVKVSVKRPGVAKELEFTIIRDEIPIYSIDAAYMLDKTTGFIKMNRFAKDTYNELEEALNKLNKAGMKDLVFDLRDNPGGYLQIAAKVVSEFLGKEKLMVYTEGRNHKKRKYVSDGNGNFTKGKLIILVNEGSASASEIVSGAVQDWDRGLIVGRRSYGKGLVQETFTLSDGAQVRLTIARYYTPTGRCIQKPYDDGYDSYENERVERFEHGEYDHPDSVKKNEKLLYKTPGGRTVYGGGGIYPDLFVPVDSAMHTQLLTTLYREGFIHRTAYQYADKNRSHLLETYKNADDFVSRFSFGNELIEDMRRQLSSAKVTWDEKEMPVVEKLVKNEVKAYVARQLFGKEAFYKVLEQNDEIIIAAKKALLQYEAILKGENKLALEQH